MRQREVGAAVVWLQIFLAVQGRAIIPHILAILVVPVRTNGATCASLPMATRGVTKVLDQCANNPFLVRFVGECSWARLQVFSVTEQWPSVVTCGHCLCSCGKSKSEKLQPAYLMQSDGSP